MSRDLTEKLDGSLEEKVDWLIAASQRIEERGQAMEAELIALNTKVDERLKDTRPMWEAVQAQLAELKESDERLRHEQERLRYEMEKGFRLIDRRLERQPLEMDRLHGYQRDLEERVEKIEKRLGE
jgi:hypothetical protein